MADAALTVTGLRAGYGPLDILNGVELDVPLGQFVALMGPNGAGKSTLLKTIFGMTTVKGGSIRWDGQEIAGAPSRTVLAKGIAFVPQGRCNFPEMSVEENLQMAAYTLRDEKVRTDRAYVYDLFPILKDRRRTLAGNMSGGEQQLLEMAMAVLLRPKILLIDEPSVGLSPQAITTVFNELKRLHEGGRTILLVEQNTKKAMQVAERAVVLRLGQVIWDGPVSDISHDELGELFMTGRLQKEAHLEPAATPIT